MKTVFQKIIDGEIPSMPVYRDDKCIAIKDISPQAPVHILLIPVKPIPRLAEAGAEDAELLAHLMLTAPKIAREQGLADGFRIVINNGLIAGETVPHLHIHILGGRQMAWPPG
ncbi:MAG: histidine triad nucleotide-binding protein [Opitutales bacterium]|nr:histidine triad nucleotide-binding protein [Opitutales bacterium]